MEQLLKQLRHQTTTQTKSRKRGEKKGQRKTSNRLIIKEYADANTSVIFFKVVCQLDSF